MRASAAYVRPKCWHRSPIFCTTLLPHVVQHIQHFSPAYAFTTAVVRCGANNNGFHSRASAPPLRARGCIAKAFIPSLFSGIFAPLLPQHKFLYNTVQGKNRNLSTLQTELHFTIIHKFAVSIQFKLLHCYVDKGTHWPRTHRLLRG